MGEENLFEAAMEEVIMKQFEHLFGILIQDPTPEAFGRFDKGLDRLIEVSRKVDELVKAKHGRTA